LSRTQHHAALCLLRALVISHSFSIRSIAAVGCARAGRRSCSRALVIVDAPETRGLSSHRLGSPCGALLMLLLLSDGNQLGHAIGSQQLSPLSCDRTCQRIKGRKINFGIIPNAAAAAASTTFVILSSCHCTPRPTDDVCVVRDAEPVQNRVNTKKKCDTLFSIELSSCV
jgi:hypothetical protein